MRAELDLSIDDPETTAKAVTPSLRDSDAVQFAVDVDDTLHVTVEARGLGALRGGTNTAFMLTALSDKLQDR